MVAAVPLPGFADLTRGYAGGGPEPATVLATCLDRIAGDSVTGTVIGLNRANAAEAAAASTTRWHRGAPLSPIDGMPILIKANIAMAGMPWHAGIGAYEDRVAPADAACVVELRAAGAVILGLTNMDEGALGARGENPWFGRIPHPHLPGFSVGGSSGGSAAAVASGLCAAALGSDTIGSIAIPASYCGVVGHRASRARMPIDGIVPLAPTLDRGGWLTRSVADSLVLLGMMGGRPCDVGAVRVAALALDGLDVAPAVAAAFDAAIDRVRLAGCRIGRADPPLAIHDVGKLLFEIAEIEGAQVHAAKLAERPDGFSPALRRLLAWGGSHREIYPARRAVLGQIAVDVRAAWAGYDVVLMPTTPHPAFALEGPGPVDQALFTALPACLGWCSTAVPIGQADGLPLSAMAIGKDDASCLAAAALLSVD